MLQTKTSLEQKCSTALQELAQVKEDLATARQRCADVEKQIAQGGSSKVDNAKFEQLLAEKTSITETLTQVKKLARSYRDRSQALEAEEPKLKVSEYIYGCITRLTKNKFRNKLLYWKLKRLNYNKSWILQFQVVVQATQLFEKLYMNYELRYR